MAELYSPIANETWKPIKGYEDLYDVSNLSRVRRHYRNRPAKLVTQHPTPSGHKYVSLSSRCKTRTHRVHRLVAAAFPDRKETELPDGGFVHTFNSKEFVSKADHDATVSSLVKRYKYYLHRASVNCRCFRLKG